jgi:uncharacterized protein (UPF0333 family)
MSNSNKKGQAAMEFLMTYGWAILAAIIAIGVLAYFGVFNPTRLAGSTGIVNAPFNMDAFNIVGSSGGADTVVMEITQSSGSSITNTVAADLVFTLTPKQGWSVTTADIACTDNLVAATAWASGSRAVVTCTGDAADFTAGDAVSGDITISYKTSGSSLAQQSTGNVRAVAQ